MANDRLNPRLQASVFMPLLAANSFISTIRFPVACDPFHLGLSLLHYYDR